MQETRDYTLRVRLSDPERTKVADLAAAESFTTISDYVRYKILQVDNVSKLTDFTEKQDLILNSLHDSAARGDSLLMALEQSANSMPKIGNFEDTAEAIRETVDSTRKATNESRIASLEAKDEIKKLHVVIAQMQKDNKEQRQNILFWAGVLALVMLGGLAFILKFLK